eukprot:g10413.t1
MLIRLLCDKVEKGFTLVETLYMRTREQWAASLAPGACVALVHRAAPDATDVRRDKLMQSEAASYKTIRKDCFAPGGGGNDASEDIALTQPLFPRGVLTHGGWDHCASDFYSMCEKLLPLPGSVVRDFLPEPFADSPHTNVLGLVTDAGSDVDKYASALIEKNRACRLLRCRQLGLLDKFGFVPTQAHIDLLRAEDRPASSSGARTFFGDDDEPEPARSAAKEEAASGARHLLQPQPFQADEASHVAAPAPAEVPVDAAPAPEPNDSSSLDVLEQELGASSVVAEGEAAGTGTTGPGPVLVGTESESKNHQPESPKRFDLAGARKALRKPRPRGKKAAAKVAGAAAATSTAKKKQDQLQSSNPMGGAATSNDPRADSCPSSSSSSCAIGPAASLASMSARMDDAKNKPPVAAVPDVAVRELSATSRRDCGGGNLNSVSASSIRFCDPSPSREHELELQVCFFQNEAACDSGEKQEDEAPAPQSGELLTDLLIVHLWCQLHQVHLALGLLVLIVKFVWGTWGDGFSRVMHSTWLSLRHWFQLSLPQWVDRRRLTLAPFVGGLLSNEDHVKSSVTDENLKRKLIEENTEHFKRARDSVREPCFWTWLRAMLGPLELLQQIGRRLQKLTKLSHTRVKIAAYCQQCPRIAVQSAEWDASTSGFLGTCGRRSELQRIGLVLRFTMQSAMTLRHAPLRCFPWLNNLLLSRDSVMRRRVAKLLLDLECEALDEFSLWLRVNFYGAVLIIALGGLADSMLRAVLTSFGRATTPTSQGTEGGHSVGSATRAAAHKRAETERVATRQHLMMADVFPTFNHLEQVDKMLRQEQDRRYGTCSYGRWGSNKTVSAMNAAGASNFMSTSFTKSIRENIAMGKVKANDPKLKVSVSAAATLKPERERLWPSSTSGPSSSLEEQSSTSDGIVFEGQSTTLRRARTILVEEKSASPAACAFIEAPKRLPKGSAHLPCDTSAISEAAGIMAAENYGDFVDVGAMNLSIGGLVRRHLSPEQVQELRDAAAGSSSANPRPVVVCPRLLLYVKPGTNKKNRNMIAAACPRLKLADRNLLSEQQQAGLHCEMEYFQVDLLSQCSLSDAIKRAAQKEEQDLKKPLKLEVANSWSVVKHDAKSGVLILHMPLASWQVVELYFVPTARCWIAAVPRSWRARRKGDGKTVAEKKRFGRAAAKAPSGEGVFFETTLFNIAEARRSIVADVCKVMEWSPVEVDEKAEARAASEMRKFLLARSQENKAKSKKTAPKGKQDAPAELSELSSCTESESEDF